MDELARLFIADVPLIDVRAEVEFQHGAFPSSVNIPILNDAEREAVGICYKKEGPDAAEALGHRLVSGAERNKRIGAWADIANRSEQVQLYCFRGGKRSEIATCWLQNAGVNIQRIRGGYKRMRSYLLDQLETLPGLLNLQILAGRTGSGKTELLRKLEHKLDLESMANHRGSAFGANRSNQPSQINFENTIAVELLKHMQVTSSATTAGLKRPALLLEDESRTIGKVHLPEALFNVMSQAPVLLLEDSLDSRIERIYREYVVQQLDELQAHCENSQLASAMLEDSFLKSLRAISRRLGGLAADQIRQQIRDAFLSRETQAHYHWISALLNLYYDPMYNYQIARKEDRIIFRGAMDELLDQFRETFESQA